MLIISLLFYFAPTLGAVVRKSKRTAGVFTLNLLLGWTVIGWIIAIIWAMGSDKEVAATSVPEVPTENIVVSKNTDSEFLTTVKKHPIIAGICFLIAFGSIMSMFEGKKYTSDPSKAASEIAPVPVVTEAATKEPVFDIPSLIKKNIKQIVALLGSPKSSFTPNTLQRQSGITEADKTFVKDGVELTVTYSVDTGIIKDFFIATDDPSGLTQNTGALLQLGNLERGAVTYSTKFVPAIKDPSSYTGVIITPR